MQVCATWKRKHRGKCTLNYYHWPINFKFVSYWMVIPSNRLKAYLVCISSKWSACVCPICWRTCCTPGVVPTRDIPRSELIIFIMNKKDKENLKPESSSAKWVNLLKIKVFRQKRHRACMFDRLTFRESIINNRRWWKSQVSRGSVKLEYIFSFTL